MKKNEVTPREAAKMLGVGRLYVYELLASGMLHGRQILGRWVIPASEVNRYRRAHPRIGKTIHGRLDASRRLSRRFEVAESARRSARADAEEERL